MKLTAEAEKQKKLEFARELLRTPNDPYKAASIVFPDREDGAMVVLAATVWVRDGVTLTEQVRISEQEGPSAFLPTKTDQARNLWDMAVCANAPFDERIKAHRLYAEIMGNIEKQPAGNVTNVLNQGVMVIRDKGTDAEWEAQALTQQRALQARTIDASIN